MLTPTVAGLISEPLRILTIAETDEVTPQEFVDVGWGMAVLGAVAKTIRDDQVVKNTLGDSALSKVKANRIAGFI
jgi:hypothetical protein